jgi:hypothetical protein
VPEDEELTKLNDERVEDEGQPQEVPELSALSSKEREGELWVEDWIRIFSDGSVTNPTDKRLARGGCGIYFGKKASLQHVSGGERNKN